METSRFRILTLNGGGSKGVYTLGVLNELEKLLGSPLHQHFDLIYGTSTGAIITSLLSLGKDIKVIEKKYFELIPDIMGCWTKSGKSKALKNHAENIFEGKRFDSFLTRTGIVAMNYDYQRPLIFKSHVDAAYGLKSSFEPGFGLTIAEAVQASCAAYPVFNKVKLETSNQGTQEAIDGGFVANNPTLFAIMDANKALKIPEENINVLNVGVGNYVEKPINFSSKILSKLNLVQLVGRVLNANTNTTEILTKLLYPNLNIVIINETFAQPEYGTNMVETSTNKLKLLYSLGRESFAKNETQIKHMFA